MKEVKDAQPKKPVSDASEPAMEAVHRSRPAPGRAVGGHHAMIKDHVENRAGESKGAAKATSDRMNEQSEHEA